MARSDWIGSGWFGAPLWSLGRLGSDESSEESLMSHVTVVSLPQAGDSQNVKL